MRTIVVIDEVAEVPREIWDAIEVIGATLKAPVLPLSTLKKQVRAELAIAYRRARKLRPVAMTPREIKAFGRRCFQHGCGGAILVRMRKGQSHQTRNGFFTIKKAGLYCPQCGGGYG